MFYKIISSHQIKLQDVPYVVHPSLIKKYLRQYRIKRNFEPDKVLVVDRLPKSDGVLDNFGNVRRDVPFTLSGYLKNIVGETESGVARVGSFGGYHNRPVEQVEKIVSVFAILPPLSASVVEYEKKHSIPVSSSNKISAVEHMVSSTSDSVTKENSAMATPLKSLHFYYTPFRKNIDVLIYEIFGMFDKKETTTSILFNNLNQAELFTKNLERERDIITAVTARNRGISKEDSEKIFEEVCEFYQSHQQIRYNNVNDLPPVIHVLGHGEPEADSISSTPSAIEDVYTFELAKKLKDLGLPTTSIIELDFCWSACELKPGGITEEEAVKHIVNNDFEFLFGDPDNCFLSEFVQEIKKFWPEFKGEIVGYYGSVINTIQENVFSKGGSWSRSYATEIILEDGVLLINKDDFKKTIRIV